MEQDAGSSNFKNLLMKIMTYVHSKSNSYFEDSNDFKRNTQMFINILWLKLVG